MFHVKNRMTFFVLCPTFRTFAVSFIDANKLLKNKLRMKKLFTLALLAILTVGANAQDKKTWDFTKGVSDETIADLQADEDILFLLQLI